MYTLGIRGMYRCLGWMWLCEVREKVVYCVRVWLCGVRLSGAGGAGL